MARELSCKGTTTKGDPCGAPASMVDPETGFCPSHQPGARERLVEQGKKGAEATRRRFSGGGLSAERLGELRTLEDAQRWLQEIARAVGAREITHGEGQAMTAAVREWIKGEDARLRSEELAALQEQVAELRRGGMEAS